MSDDEGAVQALFGRLVEALRNGEARKLPEIVANPDAFQRELFTRNSEKLRGGGATLQARRIEQEGARATIIFDVVGRDGRKLDEGELQAERLDAGWRITEL